MRRRIDFYDRNPTGGRDLIVGDIHGHFTRLREQLATIGFDEEKDRLFSVGDLVDRGPESHLAIAWLAFPWFKAVRGNHEDMAVWWAAGQLDAQMYAQNGGRWNMTLPAESLATQAFAEALDALPLGIELRTALGPVGILHADVPTGWSWAQLMDGLKNAGPHQHSAITMACTWSRDRIQGVPSAPVAGLRALVVGHMPVNELTQIDNVLYIDGGAWIPGRDRRFIIVDAATLREAERCTP